MTFPAKKSLALIIVLIATLTVGCFWKGDSEPSYAPVRPYAGLNVDSYMQDGASHVFVSLVEDGGPAADAGVEQNDVVVGVDGNVIETAQDFLERLEAHEPGETMTLELQRAVEPARNGNPAKFEPVTAGVALVDEPLPDANYIRLPSADLSIDDELRLGLLLNDITQPIAEHYGLPGPEGVLIGVSPLPLTAARDAGLEAGDVLVEVAGHRVDRLRDVQKVLDSVDEDQRLDVVVRHDGKEHSYTLDALGPDVPGANQFPVEARRRLAAAIASGDLAPDRVEVSIRPNYWREDPQPGRPNMRIGAITALSPDTITIQVYSTGRDWSLALTPQTQLAGAAGRSVGDLRVGEYVQVDTQDGASAAHIISLAEPLNR
jgi:membrane-associated protease RseP (regulator of RpoE activity)